ncbi:MAG: hypothetical protein J6R77_00745, partial [Clostridia bacterium]|nr:hypothetical protein [Clostridia bacterium]
MVQKTIVSFLEGTMDISHFRNLYDNQPEINDFLQSIIDNMKTNHIQPLPFTLIIDGREHPHLSTVPYLLSPDKDKGIAYGCPPRYTSVRQCLTYEFRMFTHNVETAMGALSFYNDIYEIYYQIDSSVRYCYRYSDAYRFALDVIPQYLSGGEAEKYIQKHIIPQFPDTMKNSERKRAIRSKIKDTFKSEKGYPRWVQSSEWPMDKEGKPATYIGKGKSEGDAQRYRFRDETTGDII